MNILKKDKTGVIRKICEYLLEGDEGNAKRIAQTGYPFKPEVRQKCPCTPSQAMSNFVRDGFIDRYSGKRLVFPGILRLLSRELPDEFPFQKHWKI